jgi:hypothetical protein
MHDYNKIESEKIKNPVTKPAQAITTTFAACLLKLLFWTKLPKPTITLFSHVDLESSGIITSQNLSSMFLANLENIIHLYLEVVNLSTLPFSSAVARTVRLMVFPSAVCALP